MTRCENEKNEIGKRIKQRRINLREQRGGYTQVDVAEKLTQSTGRNISREAYAHYEVGNNEVAVSDLPHFAKVLECPIGYFYGDVSASTAEDDDAIDYYKKMPEILKPAARAVLKALYDVGISK